MTIKKINKPETKRKWSRDFTKHSNALDLEWCFQNQPGRKKFNEKRKTTVGTGKARIQEIMSQERKIDQKI